jgi:hypothetical protein
MVRAEERALSFVSLFRRQRVAVASAGRIRDINGLRGFPETGSEHDPVRRSASRNLGDEPPGRSQESPCADTFDTLDTFRRLRPAGILFDDRIGLIFCRER